jgi:hypothetical protein
MKTQQSGKFKVKAKKTLGKEYIMAIQKSLN